MGSISDAEPACGPHGAWPVGTVGWGWRALVLGDRIQGMPPLDGVQQSREALSGAGDGESPGGEGS